MMRTTSAWLDGLNRPARPPLQEDTEADVVIVGAGITGLTTALLLARLGHEVVVLEGARIGDGTTGHTTGKVTTQHGLRYAGLIDRLGVTRAQQYADANRAGQDLVARLVDDLVIDCSHTTAESLAYTRSPDSRRQVEAEVSAAQRVGLPASLVTDTDLPFPVEAAVRFAGQHHLHPGQYLLGLVEALVAAGGRIHEGSRVDDTSEAGGRVRAHTATASVTARHAVLATLLPPGLIGGYFGRVRPVMSLGLAVLLARRAPTSMTISVDEPVRSTRAWPEAGPNGLIVVGGGHEVGSDDDNGRRYDELERWTRETFEVASVEHRWSAHDYSTPDHVPWVGRVPLTEHTYVATGFEKWGLTNGSAAALMLAELIEGRDSPWLTPFDARRIGDPRSVVTIAVDNLKVGAELVTGELRRDAPRCTHLGCRLRWNSADRTWDCHCHGSRFEETGQVRCGPATKALDPADARAPDRADGPSEA